jgi:hypothetical protein
MRGLELAKMLPGILQRQQRRGLQPALFGGGRQRAILGRCILASWPELLPQASKEQVPERVGVQSSRIVCGVISDELVALEDPGDLGEVVFFEAVSGDCAEQQQCLERRVRW